MKYISCLVLPLVYISMGGCIFDPGPWEQLDNIKYTKKHCVEFKAKFEEVKPIKISKEIAEAILECKEVGAWDEPAKTP